MELFEAIKGRRAVREFTAQPVDEAAIRRLIDAAVQAPSAVNQQPWTFTIVRDRAVLDRLSSEAKAFMLRTLPADAHAAHLRPILADPAVQIFHQAPTLVVISAAAQGAWVVEDCALAAQNLMLAAHATGLGTCWIGFAQTYLNTPQGKQLLDLPPAWVSVAPIIVGHPKAPSPGIARKEPTLRWVG